MIQFAWLIPFIPLLGFAINGFGIGRIPKSLAAIIGSGTVFISFILSLLFFRESLQNGGQAQTVNLYQWMAAGSYSVDFGFYIDRLAIIFMLIVTGVGLLIHIYSIGYMKEDPGYGKFFSFMNLFIFSMLILVMGSGYLMMFIGWEGVGLCSYLLIGFWFKNTEYTAAANKAFIMNRIGDLGFLLGIFLIFVTFGSTDFTKVFSGVSTFSVGDATIVSITLLLFIGAVGKSAQIPLYTWLPDAMAGPTPVSALIHAATMVTAGIYMVARSHLLYAMSPVTCDVIAYIGTFTALLAALIAFTQNDIKKVLAYSTVSQLGYMFAALGVTAYSSAVFHVMTHAFFKALLFLAAGSVIHAMSQEQDIRKMGGLKKYVPITHITFLIATLAICGVPPFSGFFSKDEILSSVYNNSFFLFSILSVTSVLTVIYMFRLYFMVFLGKFRGSHEQEHHLHESPNVITIPLVILAVLSALGGFLGMPSFLGTHYVKTFLSPAFSANPRIIGFEAPVNLELSILVLTLIVVVCVWFLARRKYVDKEVSTATDESKLPFWYKISSHKFYVDELYDAVFVKPLFALSTVLHDYIEKPVIDGLINGLASGTGMFGVQLRKLQNGRIGFYVLMMVIGIVVILIYSLVQMKVF